MNAEPLISIIIATYNRRNILMRAVTSVMNQSFKNIQLIVVDDGSTDDTPSAMEPFLSDSRIKYYVQANQGVAAARNQGVALAVGKYLLFLDSDDELKSGYLQEVNRKITETTHIVFAGVDLYKGGELSSVINPSYPYGKKSAEGLYLAGSFVIRKDLLLQAGGYDTRMTYGENTELAIRLNPWVGNKIFIESSFINVYQEKETRTSNSLKNIISSTEYILNKHSDYYKTNAHPKWLYHNVLAVAYVKSNNIEKAKAHLVLAWKTYPWRLKAYVRYVVMSLPFLRKRMYGA